MNHVLLVEHFVGKDGAVDNEFQNPNRLSDLCGRIGFCWRIGFWWGVDLSGRLSNLFKGFAELP
jgi:hypothetical protein